MAVDLDQLLDCSVTLVYSVVDSDPHGSGLILVVGWIRITGGGNCGMFSF